MAINKENGQSWLKDCNLCDNVTQLSTLKKSLLLEIFLLYNKGLSADEIFDNLNGRVEYEKFAKIEHHLGKQKLILDVYSLYIKGIPCKDIPSEIGDSEVVSDIISFITGEYMEDDKKNNHARVKQSRHSK